METQAALVEWKSQIPATVSDAVNSVIPHLPAIAPKNLNPDKFLALLDLEFRKVPNLDQVSPADIVKVVSDIASLGLEPGNEVYLAVFHSKKDNRFVLNKLVGFQGWYRILIESPRIRKVVTDVVYKGDEFYQDRINDEYHHVVPQNAPRREVTHAYCVVTLDNGEKLYRVLDKSDLDRHQRSARDGGTFGPWKDHYTVMCMKAAMQSFAGRHKGLINAIAREAVAQDEEAMEIEYRNSGPSQEAYDVAVNDLFGDRDTGRVEPATAPQALRETLDVETGEIIEEDDIPEIPEEPIEEPRPQVAHPTERIDDVERGQDAMERANARMQAKAQLDAKREAVRLLMREAGHTSKTKAEAFVAECNQGVAVPFDDAPMTLLEVIEARLKEKA